jgi:hypothetical protein
MQASIVLRELSIDGFLDPRQLAWRVNKSRERELGRARSNRPRPARPAGEEVW